MSITTTITAEEQQLVLLSIFCSQQCSKTLDKAEQMRLEGLYAYAERLITEAESWQNLGQSITSHIKPLL